MGPLQSTQPAPSLQHPPDNHSPAGLPWDKCQLPAGLAIKAPPISGAPALWLPPTSLPGPPLLFSLAKPLRVPGSSEITLCFSHFGTFLCVILSPRNTSPSLLGLTLIHPRSSVDSTSSRKPSWIQGPSPQLPEAPWPLSIIIIPTPDGNWLICQAPLGHSLVMTEPHLGLCLPQPGQGCEPRRCWESPEGRSGKWPRNFYFVSRFLCAVRRPWRGSGLLGLSDMTLGHHLATASSPQPSSFSLYNGHKPGSYLTVLRG